MRKTFIFLTLVAFTTGYAQIKYEKGYYLTNSGERAEVLIRNLDWKNNPNSFEYKTAENEPPKTLGISSVREFGVVNGVKFVREAVKIDRSLDTFSELTSTADPNFEEETLFLKPITEGKANLYYYEQGNLKRFFFNVDNGPVTQLVQKTYLIQSEKKGDQVAVNNQFRTQLKNSLQCGDTASDKQTERLQYRYNSLYDHFVSYNSCADANYVHTSSSPQRGKETFNITLRPRVNFSSFSIRYAEGGDRNMDFGPETSFGGGVEFEFILPFNNGKWALIAEPTYQSFKAEQYKLFDAGTLQESERKNRVDYRSVEIPVGIRHYMFLNAKSKLFLNASGVVDIPIDSGIFLSNTVPLAINSSFPFAFGLGYNYNDRYSIEARYITPRNTVTKYAFWTAKYQTASIILGYRIF